ncbi:ABC transporter ATP-binding protein [Kamptonema formosum]|uniref:ABC transporter ATP-binding protein n=1 Tax=Kamptonema formosum TaxID=331992 RepID=UPI0003470A40|nr:ABC transporter ATP-binding protein [Oscillatoria sp. PCC 10802]
MTKFRDLVSYYRRYWLVATFSIAASCAFEILDLILPYATGQILNVLSDLPVDSITQHLIAAVAELTGLTVGKPLSLGVLMGLIFFATVARAPVQPWLGLWFHWDIALRTRRDYNQKALAKILTLPLKFYEENNAGRIAGRIARGVGNHTWSYPEIAGQLIPKLCRLLGIFAIVWLIEWRIAVLFMVSFFFILGFSLKSLAELIKREELIDRYIEKTESRTSEIVTNIKTVKAFSREATELKRQRQRIEREFTVIDGRINMSYTVLTMWQTTVIQVCLFAVLGFTLLETVSGVMSLGHFITTFSFASMAYSELRPIANLAEMFARRYASMMRFHEFMRHPSGSDAVDLTPASPKPLALTPYKFTGKVEFSHISFGYNSSRPVLQDINLLIEPYQTVALVGRSGSGKSTLVKLLFRYFEPDGGKIFMDGSDIRQMDVACYRRRLAIVHQDVDIFNGTLLDNLKYGNPNASFEQVQDACRIARADEFIRNLDKGYCTVIGERGVRLSGGQKQRLGIARALLVEPDVLVFDEATSSLDYESERSIQLAMNSILGTRTTIIIAHRLSTVREADKIVVLDRGRIAEVGSHEELLRHKGIYYRLHALQETGSFAVG